MITANNTVTCSHPLLFNFIRWHHAFGWEQLIHATHPTNSISYGLWVNLYSFTMCIYKYFLPMLLLSAMKCCTKMPCPLPHNHYCCSVPSPVCLPHLLICTTYMPLLFTHARPPSSVLWWCFCFLCIFSYFCDTLHFFVIDSCFVSFFWSLCQTSFSACFSNLLACFFCWLPFWIVQIWLHSYFV